MAAKKKIAPATAAQPQPGAALTITPQVDAEQLFSIQQAAFGEFVALSGFVIEDAPTAEVIAGALTEELGRLDSIEAMRKQATGTLDTLKRTIDGWFKPAKNQCSSLVMLYKAALVAWYEKQQATRDVALLTAAAAAQSGDIAGLTDALNVVNAPSEKPTGTSYTTAYKARVINMALFASYAVQQGRLDLLEVNTRTLQQLAKGQTEPAPFPGVAFDKETNVRASHG